jgi:tetratricopeptide (TPR) repeat protein
MTEWQMGLRAFREGRMREAADRLGAAAADRELTVSRTARFETCAYLGAALYALGRPDEAVAAFEAAFQLAPPPIPPPKLALNLAHAYLAAGRRDAAREALRFLLTYFPGHVAARMLLQRLDDAPAGAPPTGSVLGESLDSVRRYIHTLTFSTVTSGGYDPAQVWEALAQLERYVTTLDEHLRESQATLAQYEAEVQRYRQMEETVVESLQRHSEGRDAAHAGGATLSPIEILFQQKP